MLGWILEDDLLEKSGEFVFQEIRKFYCKYKDFYAVEKVHQLSFLDLLETIYK